MYYSNFSSRSIAAGQRPDYYTASLNYPRNFRQTRLTNRWLHQSLVYKSGPSWGRETCLVIFLVLFCLVVLTLGIALPFVLLDDSKSVTSDFDTATPSSVSNATDSGDVMTQTPTDPTVNTVNITGQVELPDGEFTEALQDPSSDEFKQQEEEFCNEVQTGLSTSGLTNASCAVLQFQNGSLLVNFLLSLDITNAVKSDDQELKDLVVNLLMEAFKTYYIIIDGDCPPDQLRCPRSSDCYDVSVLCDGFYNCPDQLDEALCGTAVQLPYFCHFDEDKCDFTQFADSATWWDRSADNAYTGRAGSFLYKPVFYEFTDVILIAETPPIDFSGEACLSFYYYNYYFNYQPDQTSHILLTVYQRPPDQSYGNATVIAEYKEQVESVSYTYVKLNLQVEKYDRLGFKGFFEKETISYLVSSVDDIKIFPGSCPDACFPGDFQCTDQTCIDSSFVCNNYINCLEYEDELGCDCLDDEVQCDIDICIDKTRWCNGVRDCPDGSDEKRNCSCFEDYTINCLSNDRTDVDYTCKPRDEVLCNSHIDCFGAPDEAGCVCNDDQFVCIWGMCLDTSMVCNDQNDCGDWSDEFNCRNPCSMTEILCDVSSLTGKQSSFLCLAANHKCDGLQDCPMGEDEQDCPEISPCIVGEWLCLDGKTCISPDSLCDGSVDCLMSDDEANCTCDLPHFSDAADRFNCLDTVHCTGSGQVCDSIINCPDGSDEDLKLCSVQPITLPPVCSASDDFTCTDGACIRHALVCNGFQDCADSSDESNCTKTECNTVIEFTCVDGQQCVLKSRVCDKVYDCRDKSDELNCECGTNEWFCSSTQLCLPGAFVCDGQHQCPGGGDEQNCGTCGDEQFQCSSYECLDASAVCDGQPQCTDASDEFNCFNLTSTGLLLAYKDRQYLPVCANNWDLSTASQACKQLGYSGVITFTTDTSVESDSYVQVMTSGAIHHLQTGSEQTNVCSSGGVGLVCSPQTCGQGGNPRSEFVQPMIVNGDIALPGAWPWMVVVREFDNPVCGGLILNEYWVVTAAHCVIKLRRLVRIMNVLAGSNYINAQDTGAQRVRISQIIFHPKYFLLDVPGYITQINDVALVRLRSPLTFGPTIQPICLPQQSVYQAHTRACYATGWGKILPEPGEGDRVSQVLREAKVQVLSIADCNTMYNNNLRGLQPSFYNTMPYSEAYHVCTGSFSVADQCYGDSGGPLACVDEHDIWTVYGLMSFTPGVDCRSYNFHVNVYEYLNWINFYITS